MALQQNSDPTRSSLQVGISVVEGGQATAVMSKGTQRIQVIGRSSPLLEGVADLLQLAGYHVDLSSSWAETEYTMQVMPPHLVIVDLSSAALDAVRLAEQIHAVPLWSDVPILFISFSGDDRIRDLQGRNSERGDGRLHFYAHTLLSMNGLLDKVESCLALPSAA
jgi:response regulator RpfG family c-di-GMP phosphodiesterase